MITKIKDIFNNSYIDKLLYGIIITMMVLTYEYISGKSISTQSAHVITIISLACVGGKLGNNYIEYLNKRFGDKNEKVN